MIQIRDDFERSSISVALSFVSGSGDGAIITLTPRLQKSNDVAGGESRWLEPAALVTGVAGTRPTFRFNRMLNNSASTEGGYHYPPWQATRRCMFSEDNGKTWRYFADTSVNEGRGWVEFRHSLPFASDSIRIARARQMSVHQVGEWLESIASPIVIPTPTAAMFVPTAAVAGFAGQAFIANEYKAQHDELGRVIPVTPLYAFEVNDTTLMPASGRKRIGVVISGLHAGEDHAQFVVQQFVAALLGNTPDALAMRREFRVIFLPLVNSPGRAGGGWRGVFDLGPSGEDDPNRHFNQLGVLEVVDKPRAALAYDTSGALPDWVIDMHSAGDQNFGLEYGNPMQMDFHRIVQDIMGRPVDRNAPTFNGQCSNWFQNRGVPLTVTSEVGDVSPASDDSIRSFGAGMMGGVRSRARSCAGPCADPSDPSDHPPDHRHPRHQPALEQVRRVGAGQHGCDDDPGVRATDWPRRWRDGPVLHLEQDVRERAAAPPDGRSQRRGAPAEFWPGVHVGAGAVGAKRIVRPGHRDLWSVGAAGRHSRRSPA